MQIAKIIHCWIDSDPLYDGYRLGNVCVRAVMARRSVMFVLHITMLPYYCRQWARKGVRVQWHNQRPAWFRGRSTTQLPAN